jgi:hypothetical protein
MICFHNGCCLIGLVVLAGCGKPQSPLVEKYRTEFLTSELAGTPMAIDAVLGMGHLDQPSDNKILIIVGRIYGGSLPAFDPVKASFTIIDLPEPGHDHEDPGDCVFCKRKLEDAEMAVVHLVDKNLETIDIPADQLLGLETGMNIMAKGKVRRVGEMLIIQATQICVMDKGETERVYASLKSEP